LVLIAEFANLHAVALRQVLEMTFAARGTHPVPEALPAPPPEWHTPVAALARTVRIPTDLICAHTTAAELLDPILDGQLLSGTWDAEKKQWI
jgi:hypothetical protein